MLTKQQDELVNTFLSGPGIEQEAPLYRELIMCLSACGYKPMKAKSNISFKHDLHNKQIAKMGIRTSKKKGAVPFFALRFSACRDYSQRFAEIISENILHYPSKIPGCIDNTCNYCNGEAETHVYSYTFANGEKKSHCGAYALEIPDISPDDIDELKKMIEEEHRYLIKHEAT